MQPRTVSCWAYEDRRVTGNSHVDCAQRASYQTKYLPRHACEVVLRQRKGKNSALLFVFCPAKSFSYNFIPSRTPKRLRLELTNGCTIPQVLRDDCCHKVTQDLDQGR